MADNGEHTILLFQTNNAPGSRRYEDHPSVPEAMDAICQRFEQRLRQQDPKKTDFTYDVNDLFTYVDDLEDLGALVFSADISGYVPHNKEWIKNQIFAHLKRMADGA